MKTIQYVATYQLPEDNLERTFTVRAANINSGFTKAARLTAGERPPKAEIVSLKFWQVVS